MSAFKNILLVGASGRVGSAIQAELLARKNNFSKLGVLTTSAAAPHPAKDAYWATLEAQGIEILRVDFDDMKALVEAFKGTIPGPSPPVSIQPRLIKSTC
jgi:uncharacterized protein YbjT (DUF2867 family)